jgi:invasion protein IalB
VRFVEAFRLGRTAHVEVRNANLAEMRDDIPLDGFAAAYDR